MKRNLFQKQSGESLSSAQPNRSIESSAWLIACRYGIFGFILCASLVCSAWAATPAVAQTAMLSSKESFSVPDGLQGKVEFWKLIFAKYGEHQLVFHHREHPEIIYSVIDVSEFAKQLSPKEFGKKRDQVVEDEYERIRAELSSMADGAKPINAHQRRMDKLFRGLPGSLSKNYREAATLEKLRYQRGIRERFADSLRRSGRYLPAMEQVFDEMGLPLELTRIPFIESSFDYTAYSSVGAAGIWQFMRSTGKAYMRIDASIDQRRDPIYATRAAAQYLAQARKRLGMWPLAVTSYNHGITGVLRGVNQVGSQDLVEIIRHYDGKAFGFASKNFYAEFLAALEIEQNQERFFPGLVREAAWHFDEVHIGRALSIGELAQFSGTSREEIERLNPAFMKPVQSGRVKIPAGSSAMLPYGRGQAFVSRVRGSEVVTRFGGEGRLHQLGTVVAGINKSQRGRGTSRSASSEPESRSSVSKQQVADERRGGGAYSGASYVVKQGDTLGGIAKKFSVSIASIQDANGIKSGKDLRAGKKILIPVQEKIGKGLPEATSPSKASVTNAKSTDVEASTEHVVAAGQTLGSIAKLHKIPLQNLIDANPAANPKRLRPGAKLKIPR